MTELTYKKIRPQIKNGDILLYKGKGLVSWIIKKITRSQYSHAGIAAWWNKRLMILEAIDKGIVVTPLSVNISSYMGDVEWFICKEKLPESKRIKMIQFAQQELGKEYAYLTLILLAFKVFITKDIDKKDRLRRSRKLFCSYYVAQIYNSVGLDLKKEKSDRFMSPEDIATSPVLKRKGKINI